MNYRNSLMRFHENVKKIKAISLYDTGITPVWGDKLIIYRPASIPERMEG